jgi:hypothetical protein
VFHRGFGEVIGNAAIVVPIESVARAYQPDPIATTSSTAMPRALHALKAWASVFQGYCSPKAIDYPQTVLQRCSRATANL